MAINPKVTFLLKALITFGCLLFIINNVDLEYIANILIKINWLLFIVSVALLLSTNCVAAWRWQILLNIDQHNVPLLPLVKYYFISLFFGMFLPTAVGGDLVRWYYLKKYSIEQSEIISSIIYERFIGVFTLTMLSFFIFIIDINVLAFDIIKITVALIFLVCSFMMFLFTSKLTFNFSILDKIKNKLQLLAAICNGFAIYSCNLPCLLSVLIISIIIHLISITSIYLLSLSLGLDIPLIYFLVVLPPAWLLTMLPISIGGIGLREGAIIILLVSIGVAQPDAVALSILMLLQILVQTVLGGTMYLTHKYNRE